MCKRSAGPISWLMQWKDYEEKFADTYKIFSSDRKEYSRSEAFATVLLNRIQRKDILGDMDQNDFKLKFTKHTLTNHPHAVVHSTETVVTERGEGKFSPLDPPQSIINSCYCDISKNSPTKYIGRAPVKTGRIPWKATRSGFSTRHAYWSTTIDSAYKKDGLGNSFMLNGGWASAQPLLREFSNHKHEIPKSYVRQVKFISKLHRKCGKLPTFPKVQTSEMFLQKVRMPSKPGGDWDNIFNNKKSAYSTCILAARKTMLSVYSTPQPNLTYYTAGGRSKAQMDKGYGSELASRLTWQQDCVEFLIAKPYVDKIEQFFFKNNSCPIKIGKNITRNRHTTLLRDFLIYKWGITADYKFYDSSLRRDKIVGAFAFCRMFFEESLEIDNIFNYMCDGFLNKYLLCPDGKMFKVQSGTPSGNAFTTLINSIANALILEEVIETYSPFTAKSYWYNVAGDDTVIFFDEEVKFSDEKFIKFIKRKFDMNIEITAKGDCISHDVNKSLDFNKLGYYIEGDSVVPTTIPKLLFKKLCAPDFNDEQLLNSFNTIEGQASRLLKHPDSITMIATFRAALLEKPETEQFFEAVRKYEFYIKHQVENVYFSLKPLSITELTHYSGDKEFGLFLADGDGDVTMANNWLKDNVSAFSKLEIRKEDRLKWLRMQMGERPNISLLWKAFKKIWLPFQFVYKVKIDAVRAAIQNSVYWGDLNFNL